MTPTDTTTTRWHSVPAEEALRQLDTAAAVGLSPANAEQRLRDHGANRLPEAPRRPGWLRFALQFHNPLIYVLLVAGGVTAMLGSHVDAGVIMGVVLINAVIGPNVTGVTQNSATSPLILSATNTYTGPTIVNAGTMVIAVDSLATSSTVSVAAEKGVSPPLTVVLALNPPFKPRGAAQAQNVSAGETVPRKPGLG